MSRTTAKADLMNDIDSFTAGETPSPLELLRAPVIENWSSAVKHRGKEFVLMVKGEAPRHPDFRDGDLIGTPAVVWFDRKARFVRTAAQLYVLGKPAGEEIGDEVDL